MAIGWGKSFEEQVEEANQRASQAENAPRLAAEARARLQRLDSLKHSRSRVEDQLSKAIHAAHRLTLMKALQAIESEMEEISRT